MIFIISWQLLLDDNNYLRIFIISWQLLLDDNNYLRIFIISWQLLLRGILLDDRWYIIFSLIYDIRYTFDFIWFIYYLLDIIRYT